MSRGQYVPSGISPEVSFGISKINSYDRRTVRVTFTEQPKAQSKNASDDALNPSNWTITPLPNTIDPELGPTYTTLEVKEIKVVRDDIYSLDVIVDDDFSFDLNYQIILSDSVISVENLGGWMVEEGTKEGDFSPYDPGCRKKPVKRVFAWFGRAAKRFDFQGHAEKTIGILQDLFEQVKFLIDCFPDQFDPLYCREDFLDSRLYSLGNPFETFTSEMTLIEKRRVALQLIDIYRLKGTKSGIQTAIEQILGISPIKILSANENTWRLGETHKNLGIPDPADPDDEPFLGGGIFAPENPDPYPDELLDPECPDNFPYTGTCFLGPGPEYNQAWLGDEDSPGEDTAHFAKIGQWQLAGNGNVPYYRDPAQSFLNLDESATEEDVGVVQEEGRRGLYNYLIVLPSNVSPSEDELKRIESIAKYMQPSHLHLAKIKVAPEAYEPIVLGISQLGVDFILH